MMESAREAVGERVRTSSWTNGSGDSRRGSGSVQPQHDSTGTKEREKEEKDEEDGRSEVEKHLERLREEKELPTKPASLNASEKGEEGGAETEKSGEDIDHGQEKEELFSTTDHSPEPSPRPSAEPTRPNIETTLESAETDQIVRSDSGHSTEGEGTDTDAFGTPTEEQEDPTRGLVDNMLSAQSQVDGENKQPAVEVKVDDPEEKKAEEEKGAEVAKDESAPSTPSPAPAKLPPPLPRRAAGRAARPVSPKPPAPAAEGEKVEESESGTAEHKTDIEVEKREDKEQVEKEDDTPSQQLEVPASSSSAMDDKTPVAAEFPASDSLATVTSNDVVTTPKLGHFTPSKIDTNTLSAEDMMVSPVSAADVRAGAESGAGEDGDGEVYVGETTWEERTWKEVVRLREELFWARVGGVR